MTFWRLMRAAGSKHSAPTALSDSALLGSSFSRVDTDPEQGSGLLVVDICDLENIEGTGEALGRVEHGRFLVRPHEGGRSRVALPVNAGNSVVFESTVLILADQPREGSYAFHAGPIFYDASGKALCRCPLFSCDGSETSKVFIRTYAPPATTSVRLGLLGAWGNDESAAGYVISYGSSRLYKEQ